MKGPGILWMVQTAAGFSLAGPLFYLAGSHLLSGRYVWGAGFLFFALLVLYFPTYIVNRIGGPRAWLRRRIGRGTDGSDADTDATEAGDATDESETGVRSRLEKLRSR
ncbi:hypothetical protein [Natronococcus occultus]|uniref:Uncharacterized protein n=1 Tax=Natronococcus occultus SP4 TaxID=694430 RepID=L0JYT5_9EURY|nr:hypothetical protein [Natronococcus occultus]AGB38207.1 hypothetical protein Natoc_2432 [Natronococcus occultus SP4]